MEKQNATILRLCNISKVAF